MLLRRPFYIFLWIFFKFLSYKNDYEYFVLIIVLVILKNYTFHFINCYTLSILSLEKKNKSDDLPIFFLFKLDTRIHFKF